MPGQITRDHIHLLQSFGRHPMQREMTDEQREQLWAFACKTGNLPIVPFKDVVETWKAVVLGDHKDSRVAVTPTADPAYLTIAICLGSKSLAAHTGRIDALLASILTIHAHSFTVNELNQYLDEIRAIAMAAWGREHGRTGKKP